jgi:hypothetical protein
MLLVAARRFAMTRLFYATLLVALALGATAHAEDEYGYGETRLSSGIGVGVIAGVGVMGFRESHVRDATSSLGGLWDLRVTLGSHIPLGLDVSYVGSSTSIDSLVGSNSGTLLGTAVEGALRWNMAPHFPLDPYLFGGVGWQRYDITGASFTVSDAGIRDSDNLIDFPLGVGLAYREDGFVADIRGTYRFTTDNNLIVDQPLVPGSGFAKMDSWEASAAAGFEF